MIFKLIKKFLKINYRCTLFLNFRYLDLLNAIKFPIVVFGPYRISSTKGKLKFNCEIKTGLIKLNRYESTMLNGGGIFKGCLHNEGEIIINGYTEICTGTTLQTTRNGHIYLGDKIHIGPNSIVYSDKAVYFGDSINTSWYIQIYDTDFHYLFNEGKVYNKKKEIVIGGGTWIGHHTTITKGSQIPDNTVIASCSLVNKDLRTTGSGLYAGSPVRLIKLGLRRIFDKKTEYILDGIFNDSPDLQYIDYNDIQIYD